MIRGGEENVEEPAVEQTGPDQQTPANAASTVNVVEPPEGTVNPETQTQTLEADGNQRHLTGMEALNELQDLIAQAIEKTAQQKEALRELRQEESRLQNAQTPAGEPNDSNNDAVLMFKAIEERWQKLYGGSPSEVRDRVYRRLMEARSDQGVEARPRARWDNSLSRARLPTR